MNEKAAITACIEQQTDVIAYVGLVDRAGYDTLCNVLSQRPRRKNCLLVIVTFGGDPNAGYRVARALSHNYPQDGKISVLVPHFCKSAGTLICIGADELVISDRGELGPLDIQVQKPDEMFKSASGLDIIRGLIYLQDAALNTFRNYLVDINQGSGLSTKSASEIASKLTIGLHEPVFAQIDPMRLGEMQAALTIANEYGIRLDERFGNLCPGALTKLATSYPAHGFVIDRKEARSLFKRVRIPERHEIDIGDLVARIFAQESRRPTGLVIDLEKEVLGDVTQSAVPSTTTEEVQGAESEARPVGTIEDTDAPEHVQNGAGPDEDHGGGAEPVDGGNT